MENPQVEPIFEAVPEAPAARPVREPFWDYLDLLMFIGLAFGIMFGLWLVVAAANAVHPLLTPKNLIAIGLLAQVALYGAIYLAFKIVFEVRHNRPVFRSLGWCHSTFSPGIAALLGIVLAVAVGALVKLLHAPDVPSPVDMLVNSRTTLIIVAVMAVVGAPLFEEAVFRGFLQPLLARTFGLAAGIFITASLFGVLHLKEYGGSWQFAAAITLVGIVFGYLRAKTNSLIPSTMMHAAFNGISVIGLIATKYAKLP